MLTYYLGFLVKYEYTSHLKTNSLLKG